MEFHEIANAFPLMVGAEFDELVADIAKNGQLHPIVTFEEKVLDGRNRYNACTKAGISPQFSPYVAKLDPVDFVISTNLVRRQLTPSQCSAVAAELANLKRGSNQYTKEDAHECATIISQTKAAEKLKVSRRQVQKATTVKKADPELFKQVRDGKISVGKAEKQVRQRKPKQLTLAPPPSTPGLTYQIQKSKPQQSRDDRIVAAIESGKGLSAAAREVAEADMLSFSDEHLGNLIALLKAEIKSRRDMQRALEAHQQQRKR